MKIRHLESTNSQARAIANDGKAPPPGSGQFTRSVSSSKDSQGLFSESFEHDAGRVLSAVAYRLMPGQSMQINVNGKPKVLYRLESGNALVLQDPKDFAEKKRNGLFLGIGSHGNKIMSLNGSMITSKLNSNFPLAYGQIVSLKAALGVQ